MKENGIKQRNVAHFNNKLVANLLLDEPLSCIELSKKTKLTHVATGLIVDRLLNMDLIRLHVEPPRKRSQGRQHVRYEIKPERAYYICINFQYGCESFIVYDLAGNVEYFESFASDMVDESVFDGIISRINAALADKAIPAEKVAVVSVAIRGRVNSESGNIIVSVKIDAKLNIKKKLSAAFPSAIVDVKNDIDYACLGSILSEEFDYGNGSHLYLYVGGIGAACCIVFDKKIVCGANGFCGELGMNNVEGIDGRLVKRISVEPLAARCRKILNAPDADIAEIIEKSKTVPEVKEEFYNVAKLLGGVVKNFIDVLGCFHVVFAGPVSAYPEFFFEKFKEAIKDEIYGDSVEYKIDITTADATVTGQSLLSRLRSLDWVMEQY